ncbi:MAG: hypothetical protein OSJ53_13495 [Kineothrix sp.]|nr:hypothetical protein [Kineothrix sp.]
MIKADTGGRDFAGIFFYARGRYAQGCVRKLAALLHVPRAASREDESSLLDWQQRMQSIGK